MILAEPQVKGKQSTEPEQNPHLGFVIAAICTVASLILFFGWEVFGNETTLKIVAAVLLFIGLCGFGNDISEKSNDDGALEAGIGLSFTFFILMFKDAVPATPNLVVLAFIMFGAIFLGVSIARLIPTSKKKEIKPEGNKIENVSTKSMYKFLIGGGQALGLVVNIVNFIRLFT